MKKWAVIILLSTHCVLAQEKSIIITSVTVKNRQFIQVDPINFQPGDSIVTLTYRQNKILINFHSSESNPVYVYSLGKLIEGDFSTRDNFLLLPYMPNGEYIVRIRDRNNPSVKPAHLKIIVESPIWLRWWFLPMMFVYGLLFVSACLYLLYLYRIRQFLRLQRVRDRIARDLHDDMGSYLSSISILSQTASRSVVKDPAKAQATLDRIGQTARQVMDSMGDIVWSINPDHDSMKQVVSRMTDVASGLFGTDNELAKQVALQVDVADEVCQMSLSTERRRDFFLIYKEAITNAARYANASRVRVQLSREGAQLVLVIDDDGDGFDPEKPERRNPAGGNGLDNMKKRAELLDAVLLIRSAIGAGTTVSLKLPV